MRRAGLRAAAAARLWTLLALVFATPVFFLWDVTYDAFLLPKVALLAAGVALAGGLRIAELVLGAPWPGVARVGLPAAFAAVPAAVAWAATDYRRWALLGEESRLNGLVPILLVVAAGVLLSDAFRGDFRRPARAFAGSAAVVAAYGLAQSVGLDPLHVPIAEYAPSTIGQSNFVGGFLAIALPVSLAVWTPATGAARAAWTAATIAIVLGLVLAFSQGGWLAGAAGVALFAGLRLRERHRAAPAAGVLAAGALAAAGVGLVLAGFFFGPSSRVVPDTARARGFWWRSAVSMGADSPVWGHGPNVYAIEGPHYRIAADALAHDDLVADDPHSVPLAQFANHGLLGVLGYAGLAGWLLAQGRRRVPAVRAGCAAGAGAYFVQSLVSVDSPLLLLALWVCVAGVTSGAEEDAAAAPARPAGWGRRSAAIAVAVAAPAGALWWGGNLLAADAEVLSAVEDSSFGRHGEALAGFERALRRRGWEPYRRQHALALGRAALDAGWTGRGLLARTKDAFAYLDGFPNVQAIGELAGVLHQWSIYDVSEEEAALVQLRRVLALDEYSPSARIAAAEALVRLGRADDAVEVLEFFLPEIDEELELYAHRRPGLRGALAVAYAAAGREEDARAALDDALAADAGPPPAGDCHVLVARELLHAAGEEATRDAYLESSPGLFTCDPATLALLPGYDPQEDAR
ncbi:MAG: O-antigen ligase family protein [Actinomycetota bacterium]